MKTNGQVLRQQAEAQGIPLASVWRVQEALNQAKQNRADAALARLMLRHGRLTDEARQYVLQEYPQ